VKDVTPFPLAEAAGITEAVCGNEERTIEPGGVHLNARLQRRGEGDNRINPHATHIMEGDGDWPITVGWKGG
jgi:hypothetical protein